MKTGFGSVLTTTTIALVLSAGGSGWAQEKVGVVTTVVGPVTIARTSLPPEPLKFKDDVFVRDRVTTGEAAITRILLGGKVIVTAREHSTLTITETPGLSTIHLTSGRIAVAVEKSRMKQGERVDIRTPNAVAGVRGTVLIVEAQPNISTVTVLRGLVHVTRLNPVTGTLVGRYTAVGARQTVSVQNNVLPARSKSIAPTRAQELSQEFTPPLRAMMPPAVVTEEIKQPLAKSDAPTPPRPVNAGAATVAPAAPSAGGAASAPAGAAASTAAGAAAVATPVASGAPPVMAPPVSSAPPLVVAAPVPAAVPVPTAVTPPTLPTVPALPVVPPPTVTAPAPPSPPPSVKSTSPNWGASWKHSSKADKYDRDDRSGSNSGKR